MALPGNPQGIGASESDESVIKIDPDGDLTLVVGRTKTRFLVCSKTLSRSATFWKRCLYGQFKEAKPDSGKEWVVEFPEDNPSGLECLLLLVHGLGHDLPEINLQLAFEITIITNKYDMTRSLWAVAAPWLESLQPDPPDEGDDDTILPQLQWLWVTKELGDSEKHSETFLDLSQMVSTTADGEAHLLLRPYAPGDKAMLTRDTLKCYDAEKDVMLDLAGEIKVAREQALSEIQNVLKKDIKRLRDATRGFDSSKGCAGAYICVGDIDDDRVPTSVASKQKRLCEYAMQAIVAKISANKDSAVKPLAKIDISVEDFLASAVCFTSRIEKEICLLSGKEHKNCTPFKSRLPSHPTLRAKTLRTWESKNSGAFKIQARISGLQKGDEEDGDEEGGVSGVRAATRKRTRADFESSASD